MMHKNLVVALLGVAGAMFMVSIACATEQIAAIPEGFDWTGFYIGIGGGFGASKYGIPSEGDLGLAGQGLFGELTLGYDHMLTDRLLLGGFIDAHLGNIEFSEKTAYTPNSYGNVLTNSYGLDAAARLGYVLNGSTLGYVLGGYTWERFRLKSSSSLTGSATEHDGKDGYLLGTGMETAIGRNWTIKAEYRYNVYRDVFREPTESGTKVATHTFHIAANYRFGAQDGAHPAIASPAYDWTGFYLGAAVGAGAAVNEFSTSAPGQFASADGDGIDGIFGELDAGYDHDFGRLVAGIMVDANLSGIGGSESGALSIKTDYGFDILGRAGMKVNPSTLAYVLGGYSWGHFKSVTVGHDFDFGSSGFSVGGGLETAISTHTTLGIEYRYAQFAKESTDLGLPGIDEEIEPSSHTVRASLKYKFN
jgi:outer membrane immunogenic protein